MLLSNRRAAGREVWRPEKGKERREHTFRVYKELMFGEVWARPIGAQNCMRRG